MPKEFAIWGTKKGHEDIIRINGAEVQKSFSHALKIKNILEQKGGFDKIRIQSINNNNDFKEVWGNNIFRKRR